MAVWDVGFIVGAILIWFVHSHPVGFFWSTLLSSNNTEESDVCIKRESLNLFSLFSLTSLCLFVSCDHKKQFFIEIRSHVLVVELEVVLD